MTPQTAPRPSRTALLCAGLLLTAWAVCAWPGAGSPQGPAAEQKQRLAEADRLRQEAKKLQEQNRPAEALAKVEKALGVERGVYGADHDKLTDSLTLLAELHQDRDDLVAARKVCEQVLAIKTKAHGPGHWQTAAARLDLAELDRRAKLDRDRRQRLAEAERQMRKVEREYLPQKMYFAGLALAKKAAATARDVLGEESPFSTRCANNLALLHQHLREYAQAEALLQKALAVNTRLRGERDPVIAVNLNNLGLLCRDRREHARAESFLKKALEVTRRTVGEKHGDYAVTLNNLAVLYKDMGEYAKAEPLLREAIDISKQALGEKHTSYANQLNNLGLLLLDMHDPAGGERLLRRALEIRNEVLGGKHLDCVLSLQALGTFYLSQGDTPRAGEFLQDAYGLYLDILKRDPGAGGDHRAVLADLAHNLAAWARSAAIVAEGTGNTAKAAEWWERAVQHSREALEANRKRVGERHPAYASSLGLLADAYFFKREYALAEPLYRQARDSCRQALGDQHPSFIRSVHDLGWIHFVRGAAKQAEPLLRQGLDLARRRLDLLAVVQSERQQLAAGQALRHQLDVYVSLVLAEKLPAEKAYAHVLGWKGAVLASQRRTRQERSQPELAKLFRSLHDAADRLATLGVSPPDPPEEAGGEPSAERIDWDKKIAAAAERRGELERELGRRSAAFHREQALQHLTPAQLKALLPRDAVLIDFLECARWTPPQGKALVGVENRLVAFVVRADRPVEALDLGPANKIADAVRAWRAGWGREGAVKDPGDAAGTLRRLVWQPLEGHVKGFKTVLVSPDGPLASLPLAALPGSKAGTYLIDEVALAVVPVPQLLPEILAPAEGASGKGPKDRPPALLLVGDVDYDAAPGKTAGGSARAAARGTRGGAFALHCDPLKHSLAEVKAIEASFRKFHSRGAVTDLRDRQATESAVRKHAPGHHYLHLATHGFFAPEGLRSALAPPAGAVGKQEVVPDPLDRSGVKGFHPGLLSGLALAGVNQPVAPARDDGILTALEVAELDLRGVKLAVMSACETGLGKTAGGEGLLGLQRAFQVAGARTTVGSLWMVQDEATQKLMVRFYANLWEKKMPALEALRQAQLALMADERWRGLGAGINPEPKQPPRSPPYYWAAFVLSGDWR